MADNKTYKPGGWKFRKGIQTFDKILASINDGDRIKFGNGIYNLREYVNISNNITIEGSKGAIILLPSQIEQQQKGYNRQGIHLTNKNAVTFKNLIFELEPETTAIEVAKDFKGSIDIIQIKTKHKRSILNKDPRDDYPSLRVRGHGTLRIEQSILDYLIIDAPDMDIIIEKSTIGNFKNSSRIKGKSIQIIDSEINNSQLISPNGQLLNVQTKGGIALQGVFKLTRTELLAINAAQPKRYPHGMTHIIGLPKSKIIIEDIVSETPKKPPYYRHFEFKGSNVSIKGTGGLREQLLSNILIKSKVHVNGGKWLRDPTPKDLKKESSRLAKAINT